MTLARGIVSVSLSPRVFRLSLSLPLSPVPAVPDDSGLDDRPNTRLSLTVSLGSFCRMLPNDDGGSLENPADRNLVAFSPSFFSFTSFSSVCMLEFPVVWKI